MTANRVARYGPKPNDPPDIGLLYQLAQVSGLSLRRLAIDHLGRRPESVRNWIRKGRIPAIPKALIHRLLTTWRPNAPGAR